MGKKNYILNSFVGPYLGLNCLQRLTAEDTSKQSVKVGLAFGKVNSEIARKQPLSAILNCKQENVGFYPV